MGIGWPLCDRAVTIRPASVHDAAAFFEYQQLPEVHTFISRIMGSLGDAEALIAERISTRGDLMCVIEVDGQVVGNIGGRRYRPDTLGPEPDAWDFYLGYVVHPQWWGQGIATAAVTLFVPALHQQAGGSQDRRESLCRQPGLNQGPHKERLRTGKHRTCSSFGPRRHLAG